MSFFKFFIPSKAQDLNFSYQYRADIDGLRAVAVMCVVGFHAFPELVTGGFIGVDVFFVISGFLISNIIFNHLDQGTFTYTSFYARRIRRIFPALLVVLVACCLLGSIIMLPVEKMYLGMQVVAGAGFFSNFLLWKTFGYFAPTIDALPLMHLWSLSIEEQFYIVWPLLLALSFRKKQLLGMLLLMFAVLSFAANIYAVHGSTTAAFYLPFCRFWEMSAGGLLAYVSAYRSDLLGSTQLAGRRMHWLATAGLILLALGLWQIDREKYFPGWWAWLPVAGTCLVIAAGSNAWLNKNVLSNRLMVGIGLISYPLYLWHWPLLSFARILEETTPSSLIRLMAVALSVLLAVLTYLFVERPVRFSRRSNLLVFILCTFMTGLLYLGFLMAKPPALSPEDAAGIWKVDNEWIGWEECHKSWDCRILDPSRPIDVAVIGDSHAGHLGSGLADIFKETNKNVVVKQRPMCLPFFSIEIEGKKYFECANNFIDNALQESVASPSIKTIILSGYANNFIYKYLDGVPGNPNLRELSGNLSTLPNPEHVMAFARGLDVTLDRLSHTGKKIIFLVDNPELDFEPRECVSMRSIALPGHHLRSPCAVSRTEYEQRSVDYLRIMAEAESRFPAITFIYTSHYLCDEAWCWALTNNEIMYSDRSHLTPVGSRFLFQQMKKKILYD